MILISFIAEHLGLINTILAINNAFLTVYWFAQNNKLKKREQALNGLYATKRIRELEFLAFRYAKHDPDCVFSSNPSYLLPCSCGLQELINRPISDKDDYERTDFIGPSMLMAHPFPIVGGNDDQL